MVGVSNGGIFNGSRELIKPGRRHADGVGVVWNFFAAQLRVREFDAFQSTFLY